MVYYSMKILLLIVLAGVSLALTGCSKEDKNPNEAPSFTGFLRPGGDVVGGH